MFLNNLGQNAKLQSVFQLIEYSHKHCMRHCFTVDLFPLTEWRDSRSSSYCCGYVVCFMLEFSCSWAGSSWCAWRSTGRAPARTSYPRPLTRPRQTSAPNILVYAGPSFSSSTLWKLSLLAMIRETRPPGRLRTSCRFWVRWCHLGHRTPGCTHSEQILLPPPCRGSRASPPDPCPRL